MASSSTLVARPAMRRWGALAVLVAVLTLLSTACDWTQFRFGADHSANNASETTLNVGNVGGLNVHWTAASAAAVTSSPATSNGTVFVGSTDGRVYALTASTGAPIWQTPTGGAVESSPAVASPPTSPLPEPASLVYVGSDDSAVYALNAATGAIVWARKLIGPVVSSPAVSNGVVYVGSEGLASTAAGGGVCAQWRNWRHLVDSFRSGRSDVVASSRRSVAGR